MILFINACARPQSRTYPLAWQAAELLGDEIVTLNLYEENITPMDFDRLCKRDENLKKKDYSDPIFRFANQFKQADTLVVAAPYWDLSFPSIFKCYVEAICADGLTFYYDQTGTPRSLCKLKKLVYVTTAGGYIPENNYGFDYIRQLCAEFFEVKDALYFKAEGLDIVGADVNEILNETRKDIEARIKGSL